MANRALCRHWQSLALGHERVFVDRFFRFQKLISKGFSMSELAEKIAIEAMGLMGGYPTIATKTSHLKDLIRRLHPMSTEMKLVRLGPKGDGGYLVPDDLAGIEVCFSPGVADCSDFERDCANLGMRVYMADKSVEAPATSHAKFSFLKKFIGAVTEGEFVTLEDWVDSSLPNTQADLMLQMDIEGFEYQTLLSTPDRLLNRFRIIIIEFHDLPRLWSLPYFSLASVAFSKILKNHVCVHLHPNNCCGSITKNGIEIPRIMEFTFLRRDRAKQLSAASQFPHPLDGTSGEGAPSLPLPRCWYSD